MKATASAILLLGMLTSCGGGDRQNSAVCGITLIAGANRVLDQLHNIHAVMTEPPAELTAGFVPTRVIGHATSRSMAVGTGDTLTLGYEGEGFPPEPGFALAVVDDSSEVFRGVIVFETEPPEDFPELGVLTQDGGSIPLFGLRVHWSSVNSPDCPIFTAPDTTTQ